MCLFFKCVFAMLQTKLPHQTVMNWTEKINTFVANKIHVNNSLGVDGRDRQAVSPYFQSLS